MFHNLSQLYYNHIMRKPMVKFGPIYKFRGPDGPDIATPDYST